MKALLTPFHLLYGGITESRNWLFDRGQLKTNKLEVPVIAVGNITAGGTGKTPLVSSLLSWAVREGFHVGVVSRGYKGQYEGIHKVDPAHENAAHYYGDEPTLLAKKFLSVPVYVGAKKFEAAQKLSQLHDVDFIIADDAFQHRALIRDLDVVVLDALEDPDNYRMLPTGRLREPLHNLKRAQYVVLSRSNLATAEQRQWVYDLVEKQGLRKDQVIEATTEIKSFQRLSGAIEVPVPKQKAFLFSGIGNPKSFEILMSKQYEVVGSRIFRDHHEFTRQDLLDVCHAARNAGADVIFTTEKDAVKLGHLVTVEDGSIFSVEIESRFSNSIEKLWNDIIRLAR